MCKACKFECREIGCTCYEEIGEIPDEQFSNKKYIFPSEFFTPACKNQNLFSGFDVELIFFYSRKIFSFKQLPSWFDPQNQRKYQETFFHGSV